MAPTTNDDNDSPARHTTIPKNTPQSATSPLLPTTLNVTSASSTVSSITTHTSGSVRANTFVRLASSLHEPVDEGDGGDSDGYFDDEDDDNENEVLGFITESNHIQTQNIVKDINRGVFPEEDDMKFGSMFEFRDGTQLNTEFIPNYTKDYEPPKKKVLTKGTPKFEAVDNPGNWHPMIYKAFIPQPKDKPRSSDRYVYHRLPSGVTPIGEPNSGPVREVKGWTVYYDGSFKVNIMLLFTFLE